MTRVLGGEADVWSRGERNVLQRTDEIAIVVARRVLQFLSRLRALVFGNIRTRNERSGDGVRILENKALQ